MQFDDEKLVDRIYEAALVPTLWPSVLDHLSELTGGVGGMLFAARELYRGSVYSPSLAETFERFTKEGWSDRDPTLPRALALNHPGFVTDHDLFSAEEIETNDVYRFFRDCGIGLRAGGIISMPTGDAVAFSFMRHHEKGPVPRTVVGYLDRLRPHLARSSLTASRLGFERARAQADALQAIGLPGAVLKGGGRLLTANQFFETLIPLVIQDRQRRIAFTDATADALLAPALKSLSSFSGPSVRSIPITASGDRPPMIAHLVPVCGAAHDIFAQGTSLLVLMPVDRGAVPTAEVIQGLFDLTPAEARVARGIGATQTIDDLAAAMNVSRETIRTQLKAVLGKTGLSRQQDLVGLLAGKVLASR